MNSWPNGHQHVMSQSGHKRWNSENYPGTRQMCSLCDLPTGRCEEDAIYGDDYEPVCENCFAQLEKEK